MTAAVFALVGAVWFASAPEGRDGAWKRELGDAATSSTSDAPAPKAEAPSQVPAEKEAAAQTPAARHERSAGAGAGRDDPPPDDAEAAAPSATSRGQDEAPAADPSAEEPVPSTNTQAGRRQAVVSTLLGGANVADLPTDGKSRVRSLIPQFRSCYERGIAADDADHFGESMILRLEIKADGGLGGVQTRIDSAPPGVGACVLPLVRSLRFSPPPSGPIGANLIISFKTERAS